MTTNGHNSNNNHNEDNAGKNNNHSVNIDSSRSEETTTVNDSTFLRLNIGDDAGSQPAPGLCVMKRKRGQRVVGQDKTGRGLRQFSMKVCEKVESRGRTTHNEVADELVTEYVALNGTSSDQDAQYDEKNIRRRVYDALNVLLALDIISKDKKDIQWKGFPRSSLCDLQELQTERLSLRKRIDKKTAYIQELEEQYVGVQKLIQRNHNLYSSGNAPSGGVTLPFILVQTLPEAIVEVEVSEDMHLVHFDFNSTPFELHDDYFVLKTMKFDNQPPQPNRHNDRQIANEGPSNGPAPPL